MPDPALAAAARFERDRRCETYPAKIRDGADAERLTIDYQCWVALAEWLESGRFFSFVGGANPERADAPIIAWPQLEAAAEAGLASVTASVCKQEAKTIGNADELADLYVRRARLTLIHRKVQRMRAQLDMLNRELRAKRHEGIAA